MTAIRHALTTKREDDFAAWYQEVIAAADMAEECGRARLHGDQAVGLWHLGTDAAPAG